MQWQTNGELDQGDLIELVCHLRNVECDQHSDELSRLGQKSIEHSQTFFKPENLLLENENYQKKFEKS